MSRSVVRKAILVSGLGYAMIVVLASLIWKAVEIFTGYYPSFTFFLLALITFRLVEVNPSFLFVPPLVAVPLIIVLSRILGNERFAAGLGLTSYYILAVLTFLAYGSGELPYIVAALWILAVFVIGVLSERILDRLNWLDSSRSMKR